MVKLKHTHKTKYQFKIIEKTKSVVEADFARNTFRFKDSDFTRYRKISFSELIYYSLGKLGLTSKMETEYFNDMANTDISSVAIFKQREKYSFEIFRYILQENLMLFYNDYPEEVKLFKGYILAAVDGSDFEIPNTAKTRKSFNSTKGNTSVARAHVSNFFDVLNHFVMDTEIGVEDANEKIQQATILQRIKQPNIPFPIVRIMDRGYVSMKDMYYSCRENDKFVVRLKHSDFTTELRNTSSADKVIEVKITPARGGWYRYNDPDFFKLIKKQNLTMKIRVVKIQLPGTVEPEYLATNLWNDEFSIEDLAEIYRLRWQIELNYHTLKESLKIENVTSSKENLICQDILSQMVVFNIMQAFVNNSDNKINQQKYLHHMQTNRNMAAGFLKRYLIIAVVADSERTRKQYMNKLSKKIEKFLEPVRPNRNYKRVKDKKNRHSLTKRKAF